jgi:murein DD-endopeptidase MepM/ murein hydrolase activator NlpD
MKKSQTKNKSSFKAADKFLLFLLILFLSVSSSTNCFAKAESDDSELASNDTSHIALNSYHNKLTAMKENAESIRKKVTSARQKEKLALAQLQRTQRELYRVQSTYMETQRKLVGIEEDIQVAQSQIHKIDNQVYGQSALLKEHLKHIYMHKADMLSSLAESLFQSRSIVEFLNVLYYQRTLINSELRVIRNIRVKQEQLRGLQINWKKKQEDLSASMKQSEKLKDAISVKKNQQFSLVDRLRKERLAYESAERQLERESNELTKKILQLSDGKGIGLEELIKGYFDFPVRAAITSPFGYRMHPIFRVRSFHSGVDLGARYGTPIKASNGGLVIYAGWYSGYGKTVIISHSNGKSTLYAHQERIAVSTGQKVCQGQVIGYVGSTGYSTGPHLHFEYRLEGKPQNPLTVLR